MAGEALQKSMEAGPHRLLAGLAGEWQGITKVWFEPGKLSDESPVQGSVRSILGGRFSVYEYEGSLQGSAITGVMLVGYDLHRRQFQMAWVDSFHTESAMMFCEGRETGRGFAVLGSYDDPSGGPSWGWRTEFAIVDDRHVVISAFNITPAGEEAKAVETVLERAAR